MDRHIEKILLNWKDQSPHLPILLRGARQVGKSYVIEKFGREHFADLHTINFELQPTLKTCFEDLNPHAILEKIYISTRRKIEPKKTLLFLDEIQDCPDAIRSLRYFKELMPELHVIGAGSLLEFVLNDKNFRMPVGRIQSLYLKPLSFKEFLVGTNNNNLCEIIEKADLTHPVDKIYHDILLNYLKTYMGLGGMPGVINVYLATLNTSLGIMSATYDLEQCRLQQALLLNNYRQDFGKYAKHNQINSIQLVFEKSPGLVGQHFKYTKVDKDARSYLVKDALALLKSAGLIQQIYSTAASGLPLITLMNDKKFKILFLDVGLMIYASQVPMVWYLGDIALLNRGSIAEQFVGQELQAYSPVYDESSLYFWSRDKKSSMAEVDYLITVDANIIPIEVKAGSTGQLKSLHLFMQEKKSLVGIRISQQALQYDGKILSIPFYMINEIPRLVRSLC
ncbi:MAG: hypothetical protein A3F18_01690 [Legionellales bacterium RIFCSPHIGHO2_12_FULL_37_14]|nr:MAG: hypothetical protein A3F18_01690 [Legionellales bacterium RIFCSPHIGHO2_12_FULL_37_14]